MGIREMNKEEFEEMVSTPPKQPKNWVVWLKNIAILYLIEIIPYFFIYSLCVALFKSYVGEDYSPIKFGIFAGIFFWIGGHIWGNILYNLIYRKFEVFSLCDNAKVYVVDEGSPDYGKIKHVYRWGENHLGIIMWTVGGRMFYGGDTRKWFRIIHFMDYEGKMRLMIITYIIFMSTLMWFG